MTASAPANDELIGRRIAPVLARWRQELGWTQDELATRAGISRSYLSELERGLPGQPGLSVLSRVCGAMGHGWAELFSTAGLRLPGDATLADLADGFADPELVLYLRRLPELPPRDRALVTALLRALFERDEVEPAGPGVSPLQLALPATSGSDFDGM
jgi:transcriptional regulator with XRE-family HTH domain